MGRHRIAPRDPVEESKIVNDPAAPPLVPAPPPAPDAPVVEPTAPPAFDESEAPAPIPPHPLRSDGPTIEEFVAAGYDAANYPPDGYAPRVEGTLVCDPPPPEVSPPVPWSRFRVVRECRVSINGHLTSLCEGKIIDPHCYGGLLIVDVLRAQGAELEEIA